MRPDIDDSDTKNNPGQKDYEHKVRKAPGSSSDGFDDIANNYGDYNDPAQVNNDLNELRQRESNPDWRDNVTPPKPTASKKSRFAFTRANAKRRSAVIGVLITVIGGGIAAGGLLSPSLLLVQMKEILTQDLDKSNSALTIRTSLIMKIKANGVKNAFSESSDGKCGVACRLGTVSDLMKAKFKAQGFDIETDSSKIPGRSAIKSITFPADADGNRVTVTNGDDFTSALNDDPVKAAQFRKVINTSTAFLLSSKFKSLLSGYGLSRKAAVTGDDDKAVTDAENEKLGHDDTPANTGDENLDTATDAIGSTRAAPLIDSASAANINAKLSSAKNVVGAFCGLYDVSKGITVADKLAKESAFITFMWTFFNAADQLKAGDITPATASGLGTQLTTADTNKTIVVNGKTEANPYYNETATDSAGYAMAARGDNPGVLSDAQQKYAISTVGIVALLTGITGFIGGGASSKAKVATLSGACSADAQIAQSAAECTTDAGVASIIPGIGTIAATAVCIGANLSAGKVIGTVAGPAISSFIKSVAETDLPKIAASTTGGEAGDAIYTGAASLLGNSAASDGMTAATSSASVAQYAVDTSAITQQEASIARVEAKSTPFDVYDQYSFLGSIAQTLNLGSFSATSIGSSVGLIASIIPKSIASIFSTTNAATQSSAASQASLYSGQCTDPSLASVGVVADAFCNPTYVMSSSELSADPVSVANDMVSGGYVDDTTGLALSDTNNDANVAADPSSRPTANGDLYQKYLDNCANRADPWGETSASITENTFADGYGYSWGTGAYCTPDSGPGSPTADQMSDFHVYTMDQTVNDTLDDPDAVNGTTSTSASTTSTADSSIDQNNLYVSSVDIACAAGTDDAGIGQGYNNGKEIDIRLCSLPNTFDRYHNKPAIVNSRVSGAFLAMTKALALYNGVTTLTVEDSYRTYQDQVNIVGIYGLGRAAPAGYSNHQMGLAIDFSLSTSNNGATKAPGTDKVFDWLTAHAANYGMAKLIKEAWHWQPIGAHQ